MKKLFHGTRNRWKFWFILAEICLICGTENTWNSEFHPNYFIQEKNTQNFVMSFWTILLKINMLGFLFQTISSKREKHSEFCNFVLNHFVEEKNAWNFILNYSILLKVKNAQNVVPNHKAKNEVFTNSFQSIQEQRKQMDDVIKNIFIQSSVQFLSIPNLRMGYS